MCHITHLCIRCMYLFHAARIGASARARASRRPGGIRIDDHGRYKYDIDHTRGGTPPLSKQRDAKHASANGQSPCRHGTRYATFARA